MLLDTKLGDRAATRTLKQAAEAVLVSKRETDVLGWSKENAILGAIFVEVNLAGSRPITEILRLKVEAALINHLGREKAAEISISLQVFPENTVEDQSRWAANSKLDSHYSQKKGHAGLPAIVFNG